MRKTESSVILFDFAANMTMTPITVDNMYPTTRRAAMINILSAKVDFLINGKFQSRSTINSINFIQK